MKTITVDHLDWPVAEEADFNIEDNGKVFTVNEDEVRDRYRYYAYGHVPEAELRAEVTRWLRHVIADDDFDEVPVEGTDIEHVYARFTDQLAERFEWAGGITAETPGAFPVTVLTLP